MDGDLRDDVLRDFAESTQPMPPQETGAPPTDQRAETTGTVIHIHGGNHAPIHTGTQAAPAPVPVPQRVTYTRAAGHLRWWFWRWLALAAVLTILLAGLRLAEVWNWHAAYSTALGWLRGRDWRGARDGTAAAAIATVVIVAYSIYMRLAPANPPGAEAAIPNPPSNTRQPTFESPLNDQGSRPLFCNPSDQTGPTSAIRQTKRVRRRFSAFLWKPLCIGLLSLLIPSNPAQSRFFNPCVPAQ